MPRKALEPHMWNLENLFRSIYTVPVYQRPYSWDKEQIEVLLNDIFEAYETEGKEDGYYTGNIIVYDKNEKVNGIITVYDVIDGQQRIATFSLILLAIYALALERNVSETDKTVSHVREALWKFTDRKYKRDLRAVMLNSIEKKCFCELYDKCFDEPTEVRDYCEKYQCASGFEKRIIANFNFIYDMLNCKIPKNPDEAILDFADYIMQYVQFIVVEANCKENKVFSMFESINSKGKRLEEIDLIKTYIFSKLDEASYSTYLRRWGDLIIKTEDNLYDYLYNYIKAYLCFYRQNISVVNFKAICRRELLSYFNEADEAEALKRLLDDMYEKVDYYNMLSSTEKAYELVKNTKFRFYYKIFTEISYKHPKALFLRTLIELHEGKLAKDAAVEIVTETVSFMMKFLTISGRASKDVITMFSGIMNDIYLRNAVDKESILSAIASELWRQGVSAETLRDGLRGMDAFEQNKKLTVALLALYESTSEENGRVKISYDQAYTLLNSFSTAFSLDHLLVQTPDKNSSKFMYYKDEERNALVLKKGHDFPKEVAVNGMDYDIFTQSVLNKLGNLRLYYKDKNAGRQNAMVSLQEYSGFCTYSQMLERGEKLINMLVDKCLPAPQVDLSKLQVNSRKSVEASLPKMSKLIEFGLIKPGDKIYVTISPDNSEATLLDDKYVDYRGNRMTLNEWGCKVTGWKSIRIYTYAAVVGEIETLQQKRISYIQEHNEAVN